jgi:hypothetical protein
VAATVPIGVVSHEHERGTKENAGETVVHVAMVKKARRAGNAAVVSSACLGHGDACFGTSRGESGRRGSGESEGETKRGLE